MPYQYELNAPIQNLLFRLWKKKIMRTFVIVI